MKCENVTPQFNENNKKIAFISNKTEEEVFFIPAPFMVDANGSISTAVNFEVKPVDMGLVFFTVIADEDWINSEKRAFPVTIDPQIEVSDSIYLSTYSWDNGELFNASLHTVGTVSTNSTYGVSTLCDSDCSGSTSNSMDSAIIIALNSWQSGFIGCSGDEIWYEFVANSSTAHSDDGIGQYTIYTRGSLDTIGYLYDSNGNLITSNDDFDDFDDCNFSITANLTYGETYYLKVKAWGIGTGNYDVIVTTSEDNIDSGLNNNRMYMDITLPTLPRNPRIKKAELQIFQANYKINSVTPPLFGLYQVSENIYDPIDESNLIDFARMKAGLCENGKIISYTFDITSLIDKINKNESLPQLAIKLLNEASTTQNNIVLYGSSSSDNYAPKIVITYETSYGVNTSYRTHTHELGRFGQGSVDLQCGNLMFESEDFAWSGNRMPVTIKHLFNSALAGYAYNQNSSIKLNTASFSAMKLGYGFKLNLMQSMVSTSFVHDSVYYSGYVYIGENGEETYFKLSSSKECYDANNQCYNLYEDIDGGNLIYDPVNRTLQQGDDTYTFDTSGRLIKITDISKNQILITYESDRISQVTDGANRNFNFTYNVNGQLTAIIAPDGSQIDYAYTSNLLTNITYPSNKKVVITYSSNKPASVTLYDTNGSTTMIYKVAYTFNGNRLTSVTEYGANNTIGTKSTYLYSAASSRTLVTTTEQKDTDEGETANNVTSTTYTFDDDGNIISEYVSSDDIGNVGSDTGTSGINPHFGEGGAGIVSNINNLLKNHNFESLASWSEMSNNTSDFYIGTNELETYIKFGKKSLRMQSYNTNCINNGVYQATNSLPTGQYTFSAYLRVISGFSGNNTPGAFIRVTDTSGNIIGISEHLISAEKEYTRLIVPFELTTAKSVRVQILVNGKGTVYIDAAQLENNPYANAYNMLENGNFEYGTTGWDSSSGVSYSTDTCFNMSRSLCMTGSVKYDRYAKQSVTVRTARSTRETFTLSGWAKGYGLPNHDRDDIDTPPLSDFAQLFNIMIKHIMKAEPKNLLLIFLLVQKNGNLLLFSSPRANIELLKVLLSTVNTAIIVALFILMIFNSPEIVLKLIFPHLISL